MLSRRIVIPSVWDSCSRDILSCFLHPRVKLSSFFCCFTWTWIELLGSFLSSYLINVEWCIGLLWFFSCPFQDSSRFLSFRLGFLALRTNLHEVALPLIETPNDDSSSIFGVLLARSWPRESDKESQKSGWSQVTRQKHPSSFYLVASSPSVWLKSCHTKGNDISW